MHSLQHEKEVPDLLKRTTIIVGLALTAAMAVAPAANAAPAADQPVSPDTIAATVNAVAPTPTYTTRVAVDTSTPSDGMITASGKSIAIAIPTSDSGKVTMSRPDNPASTTLAVGLPGDNN